MAAHDSLMIETGELFKLRRRLTAVRPSLTTRPALQQRLDAAIAATQTADNAMTDWMHAYRRPAVTTPAEAAAQYYQEQLKALEQVATLTAVARDSATTILRVCAQLAPAPSSQSPE